MGMAVLCSEQKEEEEEKPSRDREALDGEGANQVTQPARKERL